MATAVANGVRDCGPGWYGARDTTWNLAGTTGVRDWAVDIPFGKTFSQVPAVMLSISGFHLLNGDSARIRVTPVSVTTTKFTLNINVFGDTQLGGCSVAWLAYVI